jgi:cell division protein FtsI (penicillin-binding protein 3)
MQAIVEPAPAGRGIRILAILVLVLFAALAARAAILALSGAPPAAVGIAQPAVLRADLVDRNGALLATSLPSFELYAEPRWIKDPAATAQALSTVLPQLDKQDAIARMQSNRDAVRLASGLTPPQRAAVHDLGLAGISFRQTATRFYPNGATAGRLIGRLNAEGQAISGLERGLDSEIAAASAAGRPLALSIDLRVQHAAEAELGRALALYRAKAGMAVVLDARTGEALALASVPLSDPNASLSSAPPVEWTAAAAFELGSTIKPFTVAAALDQQLTRLEERFDTKAPLTANGAVIRDPFPAAEPVPLAQALARSSNVAIGALAMRLGAQRQKALFEALGLAGPPPLPIAGAQSFVLPPGQDDAAIAANGYGRGPLFTLIALASAYTAFADDGARVAPTLALVKPGDPARRLPVFSAATAAAMRAMLRQAVEEGTGARAAAPGLDMAGKTGTSEKLQPNGRYDPDRNLALFAAVFPGYAPRYVMIVALDEPQRTQASGGLATGGAVAAPTAGRIAARIAPFLDLDTARIAADLAQTAKP